MNILVLGANGQVGSEIVRLFSKTEHHIISYTRKELDCCDAEYVDAVLSVLECDLIINAAAYTAVDKAEDEPDMAYRINAEFVRHLAIYCSQRAIPLIHLSTDYVFDGSKQGSYREIDTPHPQGVYARSKWEGEQAIIAHLQQHIILRISWVFGVYGSNFVKTILKLASARSELNVVADQWGRPTAARDIARVLLDIVHKIRQPHFNHWGIYHYAGEGVASWYDFAQKFIMLGKANGLGLLVNNVHPIRTDAYKTKAVRPKNSVLDTTKIEQKLGIQCHAWSNYLPEMIEDFIRTI